MLGYALASAVGIPVARIRTIGIVHIVLLSTYNPPNTCINLKPGGYNIRQPSLFEACTMLEKLFLII